MGFLGTRLLQAALNAHGFTDFEGKRLALDGVPGRRTISAKEKCRDWQIWLNSKGFKAGDVDGWPGYNTDRAIRVFQKTAGIGVDGLVGPQTINARNNYRRPIINTVIDVVNKIRGITGSTPRKWLGIALHYTFGSVHEKAEGINAGHRAKGWLKGGYHFFIEEDGRIRSGQTDPNLLRRITEIGAHVLGHNSQYVGIAYAGSGLPNAAQESAIIETVKALWQDGHGHVLGIKGHKEIIPTSCPDGLDVAKIRGMV